MLLASVEYAQAAIKLIANLNYDSAHWEPVLRRSKPQHLQVLHIHHQLPGAQGFTTAMVV